MIHRLQSVNELSMLYNELAHKDISFHAFVESPSIGDELVVVRRFMPFSHRFSLIIEPCPEYFHDSGNKIFESETNMENQGISYVLKVTCFHTSYVGYSRHGLPIFYDMDLKI